MSNKRTTIAKAIRDRLATITTAAGYPATIKRVFFDDIPMGLELKGTDMPAIFMLDEGAPYIHEQGCLNVAMSLRLQVWDTGKKTDEQMHDYLRAIAKAIYADSPSANRLDAWRTFHPAMTWVELVGDEGDLHMIEANRVATLNLIVHYRTTPIDL